MKKLILLISIFCPIICHSQNNEIEKQVNEASKIVVQKNGGQKAG